MTRDEVLTILIHARHFCFERGVLGRHQSGDYRMAFRDLIRAYVEVRDDPEWPCSTGKAANAARKKRAA